MKILSWNINGIRAAIKKGFLDQIEKDAPEAICLQEIKIGRDKIEKELGASLDPDKTGYEIFWNPAQRPGYSGTAVFIKKGSSLLDKGKLVPSFGWDKEGRVIIFDAGDFYLANVYFPNANHELSRLDFKIRFNNRLLEKFKGFAEKKPFLAGGDFNVAHKEIDLARPRENEGSPGFHPRERAWMDKFLKSGFVDTYRHFYPDKTEYSWWSYRAGARKRNVGWRIDYFCASAGMIKKIKDAFIDTGTAGSDHAPVGIELK